MRRADAPRPRDDTTRAPAANAVLAHARAVVVAHPRHTGLFALVAGLLAGGWAPGAAAGLAALAAAALLAAGLRPALALGAAAALLVGAVVGDARRAGVDTGNLPAPLGATIREAVALLEPAHRRASGDLVARARLVAGRAPGDVVLLKARGGEALGAIARSDAGAGDGRPGTLRAAPVGAILEVRGRLTSLAGFDELQRRRGALAVVAVAAVRDTGDRRGGVAGFLDGVRRRARAGMAAGLDSPSAALAHGMVLGDDAAIEDAVREDFQASGLAHLLAASGTNVMLLATLVLALGALAGVRLRARLVAALVLIAAYVPLAGGGPSIQRAGVMGAAGLVAALAGRPASRWYAVGLAAAASLALNPYAAAEPGWQLSFAAVIGLIVAGPALGRALRRPSLPPTLTDAAALTIAATLATAPLLALHFERVSLASLPANVIAAPAVAPLMWLGTIAGALGQLAPDFAVPLNALNAHLLGFVAWLAHAAASVPGASLGIGLPGVGGLLLAYSALGASVAAAVRARRRLAVRASARSRDGRPRTAIAPGPSLAALAVALLVGVSFLGGNGPPPPARGETVVSFLDVGQGDATLVQRDGVAVLFDAGPPDGPIVERLRWAGVRRLDALVITHAQADHEGGALAVVRRFAPRMVVDGGAGWPTAVQQGLRAAAAPGTRLVVPEAGQRLRAGPLDIHILWPPRALMRAPPTGDPNDRAVVAHVRSGGFDLLLPADAESNVQAGLDLPRVEALKVAHHGSADDGLPALLARLRPAVAAIEVGRRNTYGHPAPSTLAALEAVPRLYRTDRDGTVRLRVQGSGIRVEVTGAGFRG